MFKRNGEYVAAGSPPFPGSEGPGALDDRHRKR